MTNCEELIEKLDQAIRDSDGYWPDARDRIVALFETASPKSQQFYEGVIAGQRTRCIRSVPGSVTPCCAVEKAHAPTDDEREVKRLVEFHGDGVWRDETGTIWVQQSELVNVIRRSEGPEPSAPAQARGRSRGKHTDAQMLYMICLALEEGGLDGVADIDLPDLIVKMIAEHWGTADEDGSPAEAEAALAQLAPYIPDHMRTPEPQGEPSDAQYPEIDAFAERMRAEMIANAHKGDNWQSMTPRQAWSEISWHLGKLTAALKAEDVPAIRELAADIANGAMMLDQIVSIYDPTALRAAGGEGR